MDAGKALSDIRALGRLLDQRGKVDALRGAIASMIVTLVEAKRDVLDYWLREHFLTAIVYFETNDREEFSGSIAWLAECVEWLEAALVPIDRRIPGNTPCVQAIAVLTADDLVARVKAVRETA